MRTRSRYRLETLGRKNSYLRRVAPAAPYVPFVVAFLLSIGLGVLHNRLHAAARPDPVLAGVRAILFPFQYGAARLEGSLSTLWSWLFAGKRLGGENARLRTEIGRLKLENENLRADADLAARLRTALRFERKAHRPMLLAEVIGLRPSPLFDTITIARGTRDRVEIGMVVRTPDGLLGQVSDVSAPACQVMLLTDVSSGVGAMVVRGGKVQGVGILQGSGRGQLLELVYLKREDDVRPGDRVVSSGYGGVVPADIPIGRVVSVTEDKARFLKGARVAPAVSLNHVREVFLLL